MIGRQERWQEDLFVAGPLRELVPDDHILKRVDKVLDLSWLRDEVREVYDGRQGRPSIDPEAAVRLMLAGLFSGITQDRKLMREAQVNLAIRWFAGYRLTDTLPDHSSLTRIRQRWGAERFAEIFRRTVSACAAAGLISGETVHIDATLIRADVSWESLTKRHVERVLEENADDEEPVVSPSRGGRPRTTEPKLKTFCTTDPEATMAKSNRKAMLEPSYKQHAAVDDRVGVIVDVHVTTGEANEGRQFAAQIDRIASQAGVSMRTVTADAGYDHAANYALLEHRGIRALIPPQSHGTRPGRLSSQRFRYDARHDIVRCPRGRTLARSTPSRLGMIYRARARDCRPCPLRSHCIPSNVSSRVIQITWGYEALLRARRYRQRWGDEEYELYRRHRWRSEGIHGEAKTQHGLGRAARRGLANVAIQSYLTAAVMNLKRHAALRAGPRPSLGLPATDTTHTTYPKPWSTARNGNQRFAA